MAPVHSWNNEYGTVHYIRIAIESTVSYIRYVTIGWWQRCCSLPYSIRVIRVLCIQGAQGEEGRIKSRAELCSRGRMRIDDMKIHLPRSPIHRPRFVGRSWQFLVHRAYMSCGTKNHLSLSVSLSVVGNRMCVVVRLGFCHMKEENQRL